MRLTTALAVLLVTPEVYVPLRRASARFHASTDAVGAADAILDLLESAPVTDADGAPAPARRRASNCATSGSASTGATTTPFSPSAP